MTNGLSMRALTATDALLNRFVALERDLRQRGDELAERLRPYAQKHLAEVRLRVGREELNFFVYEEQTGVRLNFEVAA